MATATKTTPKTANVPSEGSDKPKRQRYEGPVSFGPAARETPVSVGDANLAQYVEFLSPLVKDWIETGDPQTAGTTVPAGAAQYMSSKFRQAAVSSPTKFGLKVTVIGHDSVEAERRGYGLAEDEARLIVTVKAPRTRKTKAEMEFEG